MGLFAEPPFKPGNVERDYYPGCSLAGQLRGPDAIRFGFHKMKTRLPKRHSSEMNRGGDHVEIERIYFLRHSSFRLSAAHHT